MTTAVRTAPHHNNLNCYKTYDCRRPECVERHRAYGRAVTRQQAYGTWNPFTDAEPARQHILNMRKEGISLARVAELTGLSSATIGSILYVKGKGRPRKERLRVENANRILAITPQHAAPGVVDATGTRRRIEALQIIGWPKQYIAQRLGVNVQTAGRITRQAVVRSSTAYAVSVLYNDLKVKLPEDHGMIPWVVERARRHAKAEGWHGPLAWDGNIDDPTAQPDTTFVPDPELKRNERAEQRREEIWLLHTACYSDEEIANRVGLSVSSVTAIRQELRTGKKRDRSPKLAVVA